MISNPLEHLADVPEITIGFQRPDGSTGSTPIWVVHVGDDLFVRSMNGPHGGWYRRLVARPDAEVRDKGHRHPVHAEPVRDTTTLAEVTRAYGAKYEGSPYVRALLDENAEAATLRLVPR
ncbi:nitroreductase/quinone reductase family protein [Saccharopolyspora sp. 5N708]|uniref:nitroreductase/quinone reductase family protein n=1 Tax=Saccharopolyspora sp. 5N708 TaxID=3457424 RepID=UPI003FD49D56